MAFVLLRSLFLLQLLLSMARSEEPRNIFQRCNEPIYENGIPRKCFAVRSALEVPPPGDNLELVYFNSQNDVTNVYETLGVTFTRRPVDKELTWVGHSWEFRMSYPTSMTNIKEISLGKRQFNLGERIVIQGLEKKKCEQFDIDDGKVRVKCSERREVKNYITEDIDFKAEPGVELTTEFGFYDDKTPNVLKIKFETGEEYIVKEFVDFEQCSKNLKNQATFNGHRTLTCAGTTMISAKADSEPEKTTLEDLKCDGTHWNGDAATKIKLDSYKSLKVECVESCSDELMEVQCAGFDDYGCSKPTFAKNKQLTCADKKQTIFATTSGSGHTLQMEPIECKKKKFENSDQTFVVDRTTPQSKISAICVSKCDQKFMKWDAQTISASDNVVGGGIKTRTLQCNADHHFIELKTDHGTKYSTSAMICDPEKGWKAADIDNGAVFAPLDGIVEQPEAKCVDACDQLVDAQSCKSYTQQTGACAESKLNNNGRVCLATHVLRVAGMGDYGRKKLRCTKSGSVQANEVALVADAVNKNEKFDVQCISNCANEFAPIPAKDPFKRAGNTITCNDNDILIIGESVATEVRVFEDLKCDAAIGWRAGTKPIVDFSKDVKLAAFCYDVCKPDNIEYPCANEPQDCKNPQPYSPSKRQLQCLQNYRLFINDKQCEFNMKECAEQMFECKKKGWIAGPRTLVNFEDSSLDLTKPFQAACKHKCHAVFVKDSCGAGTTTCAKAKYENRKLSCSHPSEILVLKQGSTTKESFGDATCSDEGWKDDKGTVMFALDGHEFGINAHCEQLCHPDSLKDTTTMSRSYSLEGVLTCADDDKMLQFDGVDVYSDMTCSKEGWKTEKETAPADARLFKPDHLLNRNPNAECVPSLCVRAIVDAAKCEDADKSCVKPDFSKKYKVSCAPPKKLQRHKEKDVTTAVSHASLYCDGENWKDARGVDFLKHDEEFDLMCIAAECANCGDKTDFLINCGTDTNCQAATFKQGDFRQCSRYTCGFGYHYQVKIGDATQYFVNGNVDGKEVAIQCQKDNEYLIPTGLSTITTGQVGCVVQIPCNVHSPLNVTFFDDLFGVPADKNMGEKLEKASKRDAAPVTCEGKEKLRLLTNENPMKWTEIADLKCNKDGEWEYKGEDGGVVQLTKTAKAEKKQPRVVCSKNDPSADNRPDPISQVCEYCTILPESMECSDCRPVTNAISMSGKDGVCTATSNTGGFLTDKEAKSEKLTCQKNNATGQYEWKDAAGRIVTKLAASTPDKLSVMAIIGIVAGCLVVLAAIAGLIVFGHIRRKRAAKLAEESKNKGLSQRMDTIIDKVSVEDPATVRL